MNSPYIDPSDLLNPVQQQEMIVGMALELVDSCESGWEEITFEVESLFGVTSARKRVIRGGVESEMEHLPASVTKKSIKLRTGMYLENVGTWLSMRLHIIHPGKYKADFNYDEMPSYTLPPSARDFAKDLMKFPRYSENIPAWLEEKVRQAGQE